MKTQLKMKLSFSWRFCPQGFCLALEGSETLASELVSVRHLQNEGHDTGLSIQEVINRCSWISFPTEKFKKSRTW